MNPWGGSKFVCKLAALLLEGLFLPAYLYSESSLWIGSSSDSDSVTLTSSLGACSDDTLSTSKSLSKFVLRALGAFLMEDFFVTLETP